MQPDVDPLTNQAPTPTVEQIYDGLAVCIAEGIWAIGCLDVSVTHATNEAGVRYFKCVFRIRPGGVWYTKLQNCAILDDGKMAMRATWDAARFMRDVILMDQYTAAVA